MNEPQTIGTPFAFDIRGSNPITKPLRRSKGFPTFQKHLESDSGSRAHLLQYATPSLPTSSGFGLQSFSNSNSQGLNYSSLGVTYTPPEHMQRTQNVPSPPLPKYYHPNSSHRPHLPISPCSPGPGSKGSPKSSVQRRLNPRAQKYNCEHEPEDRAYGLGYFNEYDE
jgi:hypothetical protein